MLQGSYRAVLLRPAIQLPEPGRRSLLEHSSQRTGGGPTVHSYTLRALQQNGGGHFNILWVHADWRLAAVYFTRQF